jgi:8-oxo-dGTP pyrophosphatase MutT (NUDIX family)
VWVYRRVGDELQILLLRRAAHKSLAGLWQGVSGFLEPDEGPRAGALRELREETGFAADALLTFSSLDYVASFLWDERDTVVSSVYFAAEVAADAEPTRSSEHDAHRWLPVDDALAACVWPGYREGITRLRDCLLDPDRAPWFRLSTDPRL